MLIKNKNSKRMRRNQSCSVFFDA